MGMMVLDRPRDVLIHARDRIWRWCRELCPLVFGFADLREQMRNEIAEQRAEMLDRLDGLDEQTRERIRPAVVDSAVAIFNSCSFDLAVRRIFNTNPLPKVASFLAAVFFLIVWLAF